MSVHLGQIDKKRFKSFFLKLTKYFTYTKRVTLCIIFKGSSILMSTNAAIYNVSDSFISNEGQSLDKHAIKYVYIHLEIKTISLTLISRPSCISKCHLNTCIID